MTTALFVAVGYLAGSVTFVNPMAIVSAPVDTNRRFIVERAGRIAVITNLAAPTRTVSPRRHSS